MKKNLFVLLALVVCIVFASTSYRAATAASKLEKLTISHHSSVHGLPAYVADKKGFFKEAGLDVETMIYTSGPPQMEALASNAWQTGGAGSPATLTGMAFRNLTVIGMSVWDDPTLDLFVRPNHKIAKSGKGNIKGYPEVLGKPEDWKDAEILLPKGTTAHLTLIATLKAMGLSETDVKIINMDVNSAHTAFKAGQGDIVGQWVTFSLLAEKAGWVRASNATWVNAKLPTCIFASEKIIKERPQVVQKYLEAYLKAAMWINGNVDEASQMMLDFMTENGNKTTIEDCKALLTKLKFPTAEEQAKLFAPPAGGGQSNFQKMMGNVMDFFISQGIYNNEQKEKVINKGLITDRFIKAAAKK